MKKLLEWIYWEILWYPHDWYKTARYEIRSAWQRLTRGYDDSAWYGHFDWFLTYVPKMLRDLADKNVGCGKIFWDEAGLNINDIKYGDLEKADAYYKKQLYFIADEFDYVREHESDWDTDKTIEEVMAFRDSVNNRFQNAMALYTKYFFNLWD